MEAVTAVQAGDFVSKVKCALCGRNVKDGEWKTITLDGTEQKVCMNKYRCDQRRRQRKPKEVRYEVPQEAKELKQTCVTAPDKAVTELKDASLSNHTRQYLEVIAAIVVLVASIVLFCIVSRG